MLSLFCLFTVIGGVNVYLRLSVSEECDNKDSVWETLKKEVPYDVILRVFNLGKNCGRKNYGCRSANAGGYGMGFPPFRGTSLRKFLNICMLQGVIWCFWGPKVTFAVTVYFIRNKSIYFLWCLNPNFVKSGSYFCLFMCDKDCLKRRVQLFLRITGKRFQTRCEESD